MNGSVVCSGSTVWFTTGIASGGVGLGGVGCLCLCLRFPELWWWRCSGGFGRGFPLGQANPALVTTQFDAQVTPALVTAHEGLPAQISPALERKQPEPPP